MKTLLELFRWIIFIPTALLASLVASAVLEKIGGSIYGELVGSLVGGASSACGLFLTGFWIAPRKNSFVKWVLISISLALGGVIAIGFAINGRVDKAVFGVVMIFVSIGLVKVSPQEIGNPK